MTLTYIILTRKTKSSTIMHLTQNGLHAIIIALEANMTAANVIEIVVVLAILYIAYRFYQKRG
jgi:hypothetical protein